MAKFDSRNRLFSPMLINSAISAARKWVASSNSSSRLLKKLITGAIFPDLRDDATIDAV